MTGISKEGYLCIGQVLRPQGLKGLVKIRPDTDDPGRFLSLNYVFIPDSDKQLQKITVQDVSVRDRFVCLRIENDQDAESAEKRRGITLYIDRDSAVPLGEHENFITDMIGCELRDNKGTKLGVLEDILQPGANDVYVVKTKEGRLLVPALRHVILSVDTRLKVIVADSETLKEVSLLED
jgi:16S rRNA processing protein RimM